MQLLQWVQKQGRGARSRLWRASNVSYTTIYEALRGAPISRYPVAKAISDATGGAVTVEELFSPANPVEPGWKKTQRKRARRKAKASRGGEQ